MTTTTAVPPPGAGSRANRPPRSATRPSSICRPKCPAPGPGPRGRPVHADAVVDDRQPQGGHPVEAVRAELDPDVVGRGVLGHVDERLAGHAVGRGGRGGDTAGSGEISTATAVPRSRSGPARSPIAAARPARDRSGEYRSIISRRRTSTESCTAAPQESARDDEFGQPGGRCPRTRAAGDGRRDRPGRVSHSLADLQHAQLLRHYHRFELGVDTHLLQQGLQVAAAGVDADAQ